MNRAHLRSRLRNPAAFSPAFLFAGGQQGIWLDPSDLATMFQDDAGTVPVTGAGQVVGRILDKSGNGHHATQATEASKPILRMTNGLWRLEFDGVDDFLVTNNIDFTTTADVSLFTATTNRSAVRGMIAELSATLGNPGTFDLDIAGAANRTYGWGLNATAATGRFIVANPAIVTTDVIQCAFHISGVGLVNQIIPRINGAPAVVSNSVEGGSIAAFMSAPLYIGRRGGASLPFSGDLFGILAMSYTTTAGQITQTEIYLAQKAGVSL